VSKQALPHNSYPIRYGVPLLEGWSQHSERSAADPADLSDLLAHCEENKATLDQDIASLEDALRQAHVERVVVVKKIEVLAGLNADVTAIRQTPWDRFAASMISSGDKPAQLDADPAPGASAAAVGARRPIWLYLGLALLLALVAVVVTIPHHLV